MFRDLVAGLTTPCSPHIRRMGYLNEAMDMRRRARRHASAWSGHLDRSRAFLLAAAERCAAKERVTILGSGLLLDVPLEKLSSLFGEVVLMDVICLPEARAHVRELPNVRFVEFDVTGIVQALVRNGDKGISELPEPATKPAAEIRGSSLVVSLNILTQLWLVPRVYASQAFRGLDQYAVDEWCGRIVASHYAALRSLACDVCLIADHGFVKRDAQGNVISRASSVYGIDLPVPDASWTWNIAPIDIISPSFAKELIVGAWHFR